MNARHPRHRRLASGERREPFSRVDPSEIASRHVEASVPEHAHPCAKPLPMMKWLVNRASLPGECVVDPFMGSGTTLVAAKYSGRRYVGIEIEERYCEIAAKRLAQDVFDFGEAA